jgi:hypothetical protein
MKPNESRAAAFRKLDLHDDTLLDLRFTPAADRQGPSSLSVMLQSMWGKGRRVLTFAKCANVSIRLDCDVLRMNWPVNTSRVAADSRPASLARFAQIQRHLWDVDYMADDGRDTSPLPEKLRRLSRLTLYRVQFFGGRVEVLAESFELAERMARKSKTPGKPRGRRTRA